MCVYVYVCVYLDRLQYAFEETNEWFSYYFKSLFDSVSGCLESQLQLKISKVIIIHIFYLKFHQRQTLSLLFVFAVWHFLKWITPSGFGFAMQGDL